MSRSHPAANAAIRSSPWSPGAAWASAHPGEDGHTFSPVNPLVTRGNWPLELGRRIDHVLVRCDEHGPTLPVRSCRRLCDTPSGGVWASDHFGVLAELSPSR